MPSPCRPLLALFPCALLASPASAAVHHVRRDAGAGGDGTSWASAFQEVQDALAVARDGDEIWVAKGTYRPGTGASPPSVSFVIASSVSLYGGFAGDESALDQRDRVANETVLSGDLLLDDGPGFANRGDNCTNVVSVPLSGAQHVVLDGFTIRGANGFYGGGVWHGGDRLALHHVVLTDNEAQFGGAVYSVGSHLRLDGCTLRGNRALGGAGAMVSAEAEFVGSLVEGNVTIPSIFETAVVRAFDYDAVFRNSAIVFNVGDGLETGGVSMTARLSNSIVWGNTGAQYVSFGGVIVQASVVQGGAFGALDLDPLFVDPSGLDGIAGTGDEDYRLSCLSPLIDRGDNGLTGGAVVDLSGNPRFLDDPATPDQGSGNAPIVDIGPYEFVCGCDDATSYCSALPNTSGLPASIGWSGSTSIFANALTLHVSQGPPLKNGLFYYGPLEAAVPWGDGIRCVGGALQRLSVIQLDANGEASYALDFGQAPAGSGPHQLFPGDTAHFQFYFRDPLGGPAGWNYSDALSIAFCP